MNILHIVGSLSNGGAALGAKVLHEELLKFGINSKILYLKDLNYKTSKASLNSGNLLEKFSAFFFQRFENNLLSIIFPQKSPIIFSTALYSWSFKKYIKYHNIDIINVHWPGYGAFSFSIFSKLNVVFTMRDMWLATAGCHMPMNCTNYKNECANCPILSKKNSFFKNFVTKALFLRKKKWIKKSKKLEIVGISKYVSSFGNSPILKTKKIHIINNCIDFDNMKKRAKNFEWSPSKILYESKVLIPKKTQEIWKGFNDLENQIPELSKKFEIAQFGRGDDYPRLKDFGFISSRKMLYALYESASVFINPTKFEPFGKVIIESAAVGTPVIIQKGANIGIDKSLPFIFEADFSSLKDLISRIEIATKAKKKNNNLGNEWYDICTKLYSPTAQAKKYIDLYRDILK